MDVFSKQEIRYQRLNTMEKALWRKMEEYEALGYRYCDYASFLHFICQENEDQNELGVFDFRKELMTFMKKHCRTKTNQDGMVLLLVAAGSVADML